LRYAQHVPTWLLRYLFFREPQLLCWYDKGPFSFDHISEAIAVVHEAMARDHGADRWGQKTPRFIRERAVIEAAFPSVQWLLIYRDPRAVVASMLASGQHTHSIPHAAARWNRDNAPIGECLEANPPDNVLLIQYEEMVRNFDSQIERIWSFLGVELIGRAAIEARARPVFFARSRFSMNTVRESVLPHKDKLESWRDGLSASDVAQIEAQCAPLMRRLGYAPDNNDPGHRCSVPKPWQRWRDVSIVYRYLLYWPEYLFRTVVRKTALRWCAVVRGMVT